MRLSKAEREKQFPSIELTEDQELIKRERNGADTAHA